MSMWCFLKEQMLLHGNQKINEGERFIRFYDAVALCETLARQLGAFRACAILCTSEMNAAISILACFASRVTAIPLSARYGQAHYDKILGTIQPDAVITDDGGEIHVVLRRDRQYTDPTISPALIMCTSGTTGAPKGVMLSEENIMTNVVDIAAYFPIGTRDTILIPRPLYHCAVLTGEFLTALVKGTEIRFCSDPFQPATILGLIKRHGITALCVTPTWLSILAKVKRSADTSTLKYICVSGECMSREVGLCIADAFPEAQIFHVYGLTEAGPRVSYLPPALFRTYTDCVGVPLQSVSVKILLGDGTEAMPGQVGVLWVKGNNIMRGYYKDAKGTEAVLHDGWLCTNDHAMYNEIGLIRILGRADDMIIKAGMNIYPGEIEGTLKTDPRVREALIYAEEHEVFGVQLVLAIVGDFADTEEVRVLCRKVLPAYQVPTRIHLLPALAKNGSGKIIRRGYVTSDV